MPTEQEIVDRVAAYCVRLEDDFGAPLHRRNLPDHQRAFVTPGDAEPTEVGGFHRNPRRGVLAAAIVLVALGIGSVALVQSRRADQDPANSVTPATASTQPIASSTTVAAVPESSLAPTTTTVSEPTTTGVEMGNLVRPTVDPALCAPLTANGDGDEIGSTFDLHLFAWPTTASSFPIQIIGDPTGGPTAPFALLQRYPDQGDIGHGPIVTINGWDVSLNVYGNGNGDARWALPDGGMGYLRSRGLDRDALIAIISSLTPRDLSAAIPGFDYSPGPTVPSTLQLLAEHLNTGIFGRGASLQCHVAATNFIYRISALDGDPVFLYALVIDRPVPLEVGYKQGSLVVIGGNADPTAPTVDDVFNTTQAAWDDLLAKPES
jgi:hypothetical protein